MCQSFPSVRIGGISIKKRQIMKQLKQFLWNDWTLALLWSLALLLPVFLK